MHLVCTLPEKNLVFKNLGVGRKPTVWGMNFGGELFGGPEALEKQGRNIRVIHSAKEFAEKFASNIPNISQVTLNKLNPNPLCRTSEQISDNIPEQFCQSNETPQIVLKF